MRFGKSDQDKWEENQRRLADMYGKWFTKFAFLPTRMDDGVWVFWEEYEWEYSIKAFYNHYLDEYTYHDRKKIVKKVKGRSLRPDG